MLIQFWGQVALLLHSSTSSKRWWKYQHVICMDVYVGCRLTNRSRGWHDITYTSRGGSQDWDATFHRPILNFCCLDKTLVLDYFSCTSVKYAFQSQIYRICSYSTPPHTFYLTGNVALCMMISWKLTLLNYGKREPVLERTRDQNGHISCTWLQCAICLDGMTMAVIFDFWSAQKSQN